ncbi:MAG: hypothetical protein RIK87_20475 [Fuerstiella sp.]
MLKLNRITEVFAGLKCRIIDALPPDQKPETLVILCHGFGAPGDDLAGFGPHLLSESEQLAESCRFVFPEAPIDLGPMGLPGGRAWWSINMAQLAEINQSQNFELLTEVEPPGMTMAATWLAEAVREIQRAAGLSDADTVLGGFSQGAMISTDLVLRHGFVPQQLVLFSGTLLCRDQWTRAAADHPGCPVLQSHGRQDVLLPFEPAVSLRDMLMENGFSVSFHPFNGPHTIPMEVLETLVSSLEDRLSAKN